MHNTVRRWGARHSYVVLAFILIIIVLILAGCASFNRVHEDNGTLTAGSVEDVTGGIVGADSSSTTGRAIIGRQMDQQAKEIKQRVVGATVERVGEGIEVTFASELLYDVDADQLRPAGEQSLRDLATTFDRYRDTDLLFVDHTDSVASDNNAQALSERRARSSAIFSLGKVFSSADCTLLAGVGRNPFTPESPTAGVAPVNVSRSRSSRVPATGTN